MPKYITVRGNSWNQIALNFLRQREQDRCGYSNA